MSTSHDTPAPQGETEAQQRTRVRKAAIQATKDERAVRAQRHRVACNFNPGPQKSPARAARFLRVIKSLDQAVDALEAMVRHEPIDGNDSWLRLRRDMDEYANYLRHATWWQS